MNIMTKRGQLDNIVTYEHVCDTDVDLRTIDPQYITLGSTALVLKDSNVNNALEVYMADSNKEWHPILNGGRSNNIVDTHICTSDEYDETTGLPTITVPVEGMLYLVPTGESEGNLFTEYIYTNGEWEELGAIQAFDGVTDVQINGTSVVSSGVATIPVAADDTFGVVKIGYGLYLTSDNELRINKATDAMIKGGANNYNPIVASNLHAAVFYGLSKAAGADLANELVVTHGTYPEESKSAITSMLNAPETISGSTPNITAKAGVRYVCGEVSTLTIVTPASGIVDVVFESGSTPTVLTVTPPTGMTMKWAGGFDPTALEANTTYEINIMDGIHGVVGSWT